MVPSIPYNSEINCDFNLRDLFFASPKGEWKLPRRIFEEKVMLLWREFTFKENP